MVPSMHMSSDVTRPSSGSPMAPPAVAVPCQVIGADPSVIVPEFGLAACTVGDVMGAVLSAARMQNNKNRTASEPAVRVMMILDNDESAFLRTN